MSGGLLSQFVLFAVLAATSLATGLERIAAAAGAAGRIRSSWRSSHSSSPPSRRFRCRRRRAARSTSSMSTSHMTGRAALGDRRPRFSIAAGDGSLSSAPRAPATTVLQLIMRFYDRQAGRVLVDGVDVKTADPSELRARIAPVPQEASIFGGTVSGKHRLRREDASEPAIDAARRAAADGFIRDLDKGYATELGERGVTLSGGTESSASRSRGRFSRGRRFCCWTRRRRRSTLTMRPRSRPRSTTS